MEHYKNELTSINTKIDNIMNLKFNKNADLLEMVKHGIIRLRCKTNLVELLKVI